MAGDLSEYEIESESGTFTVQLTDAEAQAAGLKKREPKAETKAQTTPANKRHSTPSNK